MSPGQKLILSIFARTNMINEIDISIPSLYLLSSCYAFKAETLTDVCPCRSLGPIYTIWDHFSGNLFRAQWGDFIGQMMGNWLKTHLRDCTGYTISDNFPCRILFKSDTENVSRTWVFTHRISRGKRIAFMRSRVNKTWIRHEREYDTYQKNRSANKAHGFH